jgi:hypothetical protein
MNTNKKLLDGDLKPKLIYANIIITLKKFSWFNYYIPVLKLKKYSCLFVFIRGSKNTPLQSITPRPKFLESFI